MIDQALDCVADDINASFKRANRDNIDRIVLSNLIDQDGSPPQATENRIVLVLTALDEEKNVLDSGPPPRGTPSVARTTEPICLNLHVMFAATHKHYATGLQTLSAVVAYIRGKPVFDCRNTPSLPSELGQLKFNMEKLDYADMSNLWSYLGTGYLPAVNYTIRMVTLGQRQLRAMVPAVEAVNVLP
jgi:hypothetical protein